MSGLSAVVLNLDRSRNRRAAMRGRLKGRGIPYEFFKAVDGKRLTPQQRALYDEKKTIAFMGRPLRDTEIACALSHLNIYQHMITHRIPRLLIMEDDVCFKSDFFRAMKTLDTWLPKGWGMVNFGVPAFDFFTLDAYIAHRRGPKLYRIPSVPEYHVIRCVNHCILALCYMITLEAAKRLLEIAYPICMPADELTGLVHRNKIPTYSTLPPLLFSEEKHSLLHEKWSYKRIARRVKQKPTPYQVPALIGLHQRPFKYRIQRLFLYIKLAFQYKATLKEIPHRIFRFMGEIHPFILRLFKRLTTG